MPVCPSGPGDRGVPCMPLPLPQVPGGLLVFGPFSFSWSGHPGDSQAPHVQNQKRFPLSNNSKKCF